jgi:hypothetical protein
LEWGLERGWAGKAGNSTAGLQGATRQSRGSACTCMYAFALLQPRSAQVKRCSGHWLGASAACCWAGCSVLLVQLQPPQRPHLCLPAPAG